MSAPGSSASRAATNAANAAWHASIRSTAASESSTPSPSHATRRTASRERSARVARRRVMLNKFAHRVDAPAFGPGPLWRPSVVDSGPRSDDVMEQRRPGDPVGITYESRLTRSARLVGIAWRLVRTDRTMLALAFAGAAFGVLAAVVLAGAAGYLDGHPSRGRLMLAVLVGAWPLT